MAPSKTAALLQAWTSWQAGSFRVCHVCFLTEEGKSKTYKNSLQDKFLWPTQLMFALYWQCQLMQMAKKEFFLKTVPLLDGGDDVAMVLSPQCFHNMDLHTDIFNHSNVRSADPRRSHCLKLPPYEKSSGCMHDMRDSHSGWGPNFSYWHSLCVLSMLVWEMALTVICCRSISGNTCSLDMMQLVITFPVMLEAILQIRHSASTHFIQK